MAQLQEAFYTLITVFGMFIKILTSFITIFLLSFVVFFFFDIAIFIICRRLFFYLCLGLAFGCQFVLSYAFFCVHFFLLTNKCFCVVLLMCAKLQKNILISKRIKKIRRIIARTGCFFYVAGMIMGYLWIEFCPALI